MTDEQALKARKAEIAKIEKESLGSTSLRSDVISLYMGGEYWLYRYKKYTDVRLVFAPERQIAFYGGDPDNFTYPRYDLDMALFRVYENNKAVESKEYLKWDAKGPRPGDLVFVSGNPGSTERLETMAQIETERDYIYPVILKRLRRRVEILKNYSSRGPEQAREATRQIFGLENSLKGLTGRYNGLLDKNLMAKRERDEKDFRALVESKPELREKYGSAWSVIAEAEKKSTETYKERVFRSVSTSPLAGLALTM